MQNFCGSQESLASDKEFFLFICIQAGNASFGKMLWNDSAAGCLPLGHYHHEHHFLKTIPRIKSALMHC